MPLSAAAEPSCSPDDLRAASAPRPEALEAIDVPAGESMLPGRLDDPVDVIIRGGARARRWRDIAECRPPLAVQRLDDDRLGEVRAHPILFVEALELFVRGRGDDPINAVLVRADEVGEGLNSDIEAAELRHLE